MLSLVAQSCPTLCDPKDCMELTKLLYPWILSRQEYWSGLQCHSPGDLPNPGIEPRSPALQADFYQLSYKGSSYVEHVMWNVTLDESQAGIKTAEEWQQPQIHRWYHFNGRKWRGTKEPLDESEGEGWKPGLKPNIQKTDHGIQSHHFMANRWGNNGKQWQILFSWALKSLWTVTAVTKLQDTWSLEGKLWQT